MNNHKKPSRRNFIVGSVALTTLGTIALQLPSPSRDTQVISTAEQKIVTTIAQAMFPIGFFSVSGGDTVITQRFDTILVEHLDPLQRRGIRYLLRLLNIQSYAQHQQGIAQLKTAHVTALLQGWDKAHSGAQAMAMEALKALLAMAYFAEPSVLSELGWTLGCGKAHE